MTDPFKMPNPFGTNHSGSNPLGQHKPANFIEALRDQGQMATTGIASTAMEQLFGTPTNPNQQPYPNPNQYPQNPQNPNQQPFNFAEFLKMRENKIRQQERGLADQQRRTETVLFHQKEERAKKEIEAIKEEIKKIIDVTAGVSAELMAAEQSVMSNTVEAGTYQINFFQRVRKLLALARKRLSESQHWLELFNSRQKHRSYYWGQVKKSGTKFMLSQERYMATQAG